MPGPMLPLFCYSLANAVFTLWFNLQTNVVFQIQLFFRAIVVGYVLGDCSLTADAVPVISRFRRGCTCDVRQFRCTGVYVIASDMYNSENHTCMLQSADSQVDRQIVTVNVLSFHV